MRPFIFTVFSLCCLVMLYTGVGAASFTDDMDSIFPDAIAQYSGLSRAISTGDAPDKTQATFADITSPVGSAVYRVTGATSIQAVINSGVGTFVHQHQNEPGKYIMGIYSGGSRNPSDVIQALYCPGSDAVYTMAGGQLQQLWYMNEYVFGAVLTPPAGELIGFGVNFYFSYDGVNFTRANARWQSVEHTETYCFEWYTASVPAEAKYVKAEINDVTKIPTPYGEIPNDVTKTRLASVTIEGEKLTMGEPEPVIEQPVSYPKLEIEVYYRNEPPSSSGRKTEAAGTDAPEVAQSEGKSSSSLSSSKFEGTITSSSKAERSKSQVSASEPNPASSKKEPVQETTEAESTEIQEQAIQIVRGDQADMPKTAVTVYIIAATGAIVLLLLRK